MKKWIKEPLLHFLLLGALLFVVYKAANNGKDDEFKIVIDDDKINHLSALWELQWKREPTSEEMNQLVDNYVREEIFYQEALRMNLDHNDEIVKRRLSQKMEFMANDLTKLIEPATEENLKKYFDANKDKYVVPNSYSLKIITFSPANHQDPKNKAKSVLEKVNSMNEVALVNQGDQLLLPAEFNQASKTEITRELGEEFYEALENKTLKKWIGPITSAYGEHLVFISEKKDAYVPEMESIAKQLKRDYEYNVETETKDNIYHDLKKKYKIVIESNRLNQTQKNELSTALNLVQK